MGQHQASNIHLVEISEGKKWALKNRKKRGPQTSLIWWKTITAKMYKAQQASRKTNIKRSTPKHTIIKLWKPKTNRKNWKEQEKKDSLHIRVHQYE